MEDNPWKVWIFDCSILVYILKNIMLNVIIFIERIEIIASYMGIFVPQRIFYPRGFLTPGDFDTRGFLA